MSDQMKAATLRVVEEAWNQGNLDALDEVFAVGIVRHRSPLSDIKGLDALRQSVIDLRSSFPDLKLTVDEIVVEGDVSAFRWTFCGTQTGPSPSTGLPPTGEYVTVTGCAVSHWEGGKVIEEWGHNNRESILKQLGYPP